MTKFSRGSKAKGRCQRCGDKVAYLALINDGRIPGLRVCQSCYDIKPPQEKPIDLNDGIALKKPSPDIDDDGTVSTTLTAAMGWDRMFGGPA